MKWHGIIAAIAVATIVGYRMLYPSLTIRYRLTLEAQVDSEPKVGSGVIEVTYSKQSRFAAQRDLIVGYRGEAVVLDLDSRRTLFALLKAGSDSRSIPESIILRAFNFDGGAFPGTSVEDGLEQLRRLSGKRELPLDNLPMLVRFRDLNDPKTVEQVDPHDLAASFGAGAKLERATLEIVPAGTWPFNLYGFTGAPITVGIEKRLGWLSQYYNRQFDDQRFETASSSLRLANSLASGAFRTGL